MHPLALVSYIFFFSEKIPKKGGKKNQHVFNSQIHTFSFINDMEIIATYRQ